MIPGLPAAGDTRPSQHDRGLDDEPHLGVSRSRETSGRAGDGRVGAKAGEDMDGRAVAIDEVVDLLLPTRRR